MAKQKERITAPRAFLEGLARIFDPFSNIDSTANRKSVAEQFQEDWEKIGRDMKSVFPDIEEQVKEGRGQ